MAELSNIEIPYPEYDAKNLFVRDDKKRNYFFYARDYEIFSVNSKMKM